MTPVPPSPSLDLDHEFGAYLVDLQLQPLSRAAEQLEARVAGYDSPLAMHHSFHSLFAAARPSTSDPLPIPAPVMAMYRLADYYMETEGDLAMTVERPIQLGVTDLIIDHKTPSVRRAWEDIYLESAVHEALIAIYRDLKVYGVACPFVTMDNRRRQPVSITLFDPKTIRIGHEMVGGFYGTLVGPRSLIQNMADAVRQLQERPLAYAPIIGQIGATGIRISPEAMQLVRDPLAPPYLAYPRPPFRRSFRLLSTRQILEEMIRGTIEGYKNQLWHVAVGTRELPASPEEIRRVATALEATKGDRTGVLVTRGNVTVQVHTPTVDRTLISEKWQELTIQLLRQRGFSLRILSGEQTAAGRDNREVDVKVFVGTLDFDRQALLRWLRYLNRLYIRSKGLPASYEPIIRFRKSALQIAAEVADVILPMYTTGLLSAHTALAETDHNYDTELAHKREEQPYRDLFGPPPSFNQQVTRPDQPVTQVSSPRSPGRPPESSNLPPNPSLNQPANPQ